MIPTKVLWLRRFMEIVAAALVLTIFVITCDQTSRILMAINAEPKVELKLEARAAFVGNIIGAMVSGLLALSAAFGVVRWERSQERRRIEREKRELSEATLGALVEIEFAEWISILETKIGDLADVNSGAFAAKLHTLLIVPFKTDTTLREEWTRKNQALSAMLHSLEASASELQKHLKDIQQYDPETAGGKSAYYASYAAPAAFRKLLRAMHAFYLNLARFIEKLDWLVNRTDLAERARKLSELSLKKVDSVVDRSRPAG